jgi:hypothetical protein
MAPSRLDYLTVIARIGSLIVAVVQVLSVTRRKGG